MPYKHTLTNKTFALCGILGVLVVGASFAAVRGREARQTAIRFYSSEMTSVRFSGDVTVGRHIYHVENGSVTARDSRVDARGQYDALRLAYALSLARIAPILDLEGTDPDLLRSATQDLARVQNALADLQASSSDKKLVRDALYPVSFLFSLADLEEARKTFLASKNDADEQTYRTRLLSAIREGEKNLRLFEDAHTHIPETEYALTGGVITTESTLQMIQKIKTGYARIRLAAQKRALCIGGDVRKCGHDLSIDIPKSRTVVRTSPSPTPLMNEILSIREAGGDTNFSKGSFVALLDSACVRGSVGPHYFNILDSPLSSHYPTLEYVGDIFFFRLDNPRIGIPFSRLGASYLLYTSTSFYSCPEGARDLARAAAVIHISRIARKNSAGMLTEPGVAQKGIISENAALRYLENSFSGKTKATKGDMLASYLMLKDNSALLDRIVKEIAVFGQRDVDIVRTGVAGEITPQFLFSVKSGLYPLFLAHNPSAGTRDINPYSDDEQNMNSPAIVRWSQLRADVSKEKIASDIKTYLASHTKPESLIRVESGSPTPAN